MANVIGIDMNGNGVRIIRRSGTAEEQVIVLSYTEVACAASMLRKHLLPLVPVEVPAELHHYGAPGVFGHVLDMHATTMLCVYCKCGGGPIGDGPCPARDQKCGHLIPLEAERVKQP